MKIIIIGAGGFIGYAAVKHFLSEGQEVYGVDILPIDGLPAENFFLLDATNPDFDHIFRQHTFQYCLNASGAANVGVSIKSPLLDYQLNTANVFRMLDAIRKHAPQCKYLNISSAAVYGNPQYLPIDEKHPIQPLSPYGWHKYQSEIICKEFYHLYRIRTCSIRVFSAFGPGLRKQLFWDLYLKAQNNQKVVLYGTGDESRDFIYIEDLMNAIALVFKKAHFYAEVINVANEQEITIAEASNLFFKYLNPELEYVFSGEYKPGDPNNWCASITYLRLMGYQPTFTFEQGIKSYIKWLEDQK